MELPLEIILHILQHLVVSLSIRRILRLRLVNTLFATEIPPLLFRHLTSEKDDFILNRWLKIPEQCKREYIRSKIGLHHTAQCGFSHHAHEMLRTELARTSPGVPFIDRIVDAGLHIRQDRWAMFHPARYDRYMAWYRKQVEPGSPHRLVWEDVEETVLTVLASSAAMRNEADVLSWALESGVKLGQMSERLALSAIELVARLGSAEMAALVLDRGYRIQEQKAFGKMYPVLNEAVWGQNVDVLAVWLEHLRRSGDEHFQFNVAHLMRVSATRGFFTMVEFLEAWFEGDTQALLYDLLCDAIRSDEPYQIPRFLGYRGFDRTKWTRKYPKGPIFTLLLMPWIERPLIPLENLLKGGVDPDGRYPGVVGTPLQRAVEQGRVDLAAKLIYFGADVNASCIPRRMRKRSVVPLLLLAARKRNYEMVRLLLNKGADPASVTSDEKHGKYIQDVVDGKV